MCHQLPLNRPKKIFIEPELALRRFKEDEKVNIFENASSVLISNYIQKYKGDFESFEKLNCSFKYNNKSINVVELSVIFRGENLKYSGVASTKTLAMAIASSKMLEKIRSIDSYIFMPKFCIGLPNYRGHCFFVPVFVPLFNDSDFVFALLKAFEVSTQVIIENNIQKPEKNKDESLFLWTRVIYNFFSSYSKASQEGEIIIKHHPKNIQRAYPEIYTQAMDQCFKQAGYKNDLEVDRRLMKVVIQLAEHVWNDYKTPGGFSWRLYEHVVTKINSEFYAALLPSPFTDVLFTTYLFEYKCDKCAASLRRKVVTPFLNIPTVHSYYQSLQDFFDEPSSFINFQELQCSHKKQAKACGSPITDTISRFKFIKLPKTLVIKAVGYIGGLYKVEVPETLNIVVDTEVKKYVKVAYSLDYEVWNRGTSGKLKSLRMIEPEQGDESAGKHAIAMVKTSEGYFEINNSHVFEPLKYFTHAIDDTLVFYKEDDLNQFIPHVGNYYKNNGEKVMATGQQKADKNEDNDDDSSVMDWFED
ncbi:uncharacterized protein LOC112538724 isoform X2 [Tetranychus urticae]|uniref:uncharacterized protein LOC112538724 isoform X2 n=1 Tax=Tetranychus urticae TaxID=32264 RepID=UPI000D64871F|nr:uncharacterized protein LOC112538724 isoform X2 [Tetranychus urticae]